MKLATTGLRLFFSEQAVMTARSNFRWLTQCYWKFLARIASCLLAACGSHQVV